MIWMGGWLVRGGGGVPLMECGYGLCPKKGNIPNVQFYQWVWRVAFKIQ